MNAASTSSTHSVIVLGQESILRVKSVDDSRTPIPVFKISITASLALRTSGNLAVATVVWMTGARRIVTSVTMPRVPSAPMNSFVVSNPADDLRERRLVLMTSPDGSTTVYTYNSQQSR